MRHIKLANSEISSDLIVSYISTNYQIVIDSETANLCIDRHSEPLAQLFATSGNQCAALITAYNPFSKQKNLEENLMVNAELHIVLEQYASLVFEGISSDPSGVWPIEKSFLALGINLKTARLLGKQFRQNAIVWTDTDAIPRLILLH